MNLPADPMGMRHGCCSSGDMGSIVGGLSLVPGLNPSQIISIRPDLRNIPTWGLASRCEQLDGGTSRREVR